MKYYLSKIEQYEYTCKTGEKNFTTIQTLISVFDSKESLDLYLSNTDSSDMYVIDVGTE